MKCLLLDASELVARLNLIFVALRREFPKTWVSVSGDNFEGGTYNMSDGIPVASAERWRNGVCIHVNFRHHSPFAPQPPKVGGAIDMLSVQVGRASELLYPLFADLDANRWGVSFGRFVHPRDVLCRVKATTLTRPEGNVLLLLASTTSLRPKDRHLRDLTWP